MSNLLFRSLSPRSNKEIIKRLQKRAQVDDTEAICTLGCYYFNGVHSLPQDYDKALELYHRAVELGHIGACYNIGCAYNNGKGVEIDKKKAEHYWEQAAMEGRAYARYNLGIFEDNRGDMERALKHYMIAVTFGHHNSLKKIKKLYSNGQASKEEYTQALRAHQKYLDEVRSVQRDKAAAAYEGYKYC